MKLARYHTGRDKFIAFTGRFMAGRWARFRSLEARLSNAKVSVRWFQASTTRSFPILIAGPTA